ncbi:MAG: autoinducer binding domain-containing protein, partial [Alphaproteobacteria bacterium]|nr:autoinducer binding domain-containing protein [Alphaproteobacteria bacterium]
MQLTATAFEFIEEVDRKNDIPSLVGSFQNLIRRFGMDCFMLGDPSRPHELREDRLLASTWPEGWLNHWLSSNYIHSDPVLHQLLVRNEPVRWSKITAN